LVARGQRGRAYRRGLELRHNIDLHMEAKIMQRSRPCESLHVIHILQSVFLDGRLTS
jgi:hypothetical protein